MTLFHRFADLPQEARKGVVVIGNFDGVHLGHQAILQQARQQADNIDNIKAANNIKKAANNTKKADNIKQADKKNGAAVTAVIFDPHPRRFFNPQASSLRLTSLPTRTRLLTDYGADYVLALTFDAQMANMPPQAFIDDILVNGLQAQTVCVGHDFHFGKDRSGTPAMLQQQGQEKGFTVILVPAITPPGINAPAYSSTAIRECLARGDIRKANELLGHCWQLEGKVQPGQQRGRQLGTQTANIILADYHLPLFGVYAVQVDIKTGAFAGSPRKNGIANLGIRPSFAEGDNNDNNAPEVHFEVHIFDFDGQLYGAELCISMVDFIRPERKFANPEMLKAQIDKDIAAARGMLAANGTDC